MSKTIDMIGLSFGLLLVIEAGRRTKTDGYWYFCSCECGRVIEVRGRTLRNGDSKSCGCLARRVAKEKNTTHGHSTLRTPTYQSWLAMRRRCADVADENYGGRGIEICERWASFENFLSDMGERPSGASIDRINPNGDYEPGNCRWATAIEQRHNRRDGIKITPGAYREIRRRVAGGESQSAVARRFNVDPSAVSIAAGQWRRR